MLKRLGLLQKFGLVGGVCALLLGLSLTASVYGIKKMTGGFLTFADRDQAIALDLKDMYAQGLQSEQATRNILLNPADEKARQNYKKAREDFDRAYADIAARSGGLPEVRSEMESVMGIWKEATVLQLQVQSLATEGRRDAALSLLVKDETPKWREVRAKIMKLGEDRVKKMNGTRKDIIDLSGNALAFSVVFGAFAIVGAFGLMAVLVMGIIGNIRKLSGMVQTVTTTWDLTNRLEVTTGDEIGRLAADFNLMTERLAEVVAQVNRSGKELNRVSADIHKVSRQVVNAIELQSGGVNDTSSAMTQIIASINEVADSVTALSHSAQESASSILELAASVEEVAQNSESLGSSVEDVCGSIVEMSASVKQVSNSAGSLLDASNTTVSSIMEMENSMNEVKRNAFDSASIADEVRRDAETGRQAVEAVVAGINEIKTESHITAEVISTLSKRADDIGAIISVIEGVAEETNLLALNAAIIAAQAGEYGKGFAVVAEEIKDLSDRTSSSTHEITRVIQAVQEETRRAVEAIDRAEKSIGEGEALSRKSGDALDKIVTGVQQVTGQIENIARATSEQASGSNMIREAMEQVSDMVQQIAGATREQTMGSDLITEAVEKMRAITLRVKASTREQSNVAIFIGRTTESITEMIETIKRACNEQRQGGEQVSPSIENIRMSAGSNLEAVKVLDEAFDNLAGQIRILDEEIGRFRIGGGSSVPGTRQ